MSYVRWSSPGHPWDYDSQLYVYDDVNGGITCCCCILLPDDIHHQDFNVPTREEMIIHVREHIAMDHAVPGFVIPRLEMGRNFN